MDFNTTLVIVIGIVIVVCVALWLGREIIIGKDENGYYLKTKAAQAKEDGDQATNIELITDTELNRVKANNVKISSVPNDKPSNTHIKLFTNTKATECEFGDISVDLHQKAKTEKENV